jgi:hypothetical protein
MIASVCLLMLLQVFMSLFGLVSISFAIYVVGN